MVCAKGTRQQQEERVWIMDRDSCKMAARECVVAEEREMMACSSAESHAHSVGGQSSSSWAAGQPHFE